MFRSNKIEKYGAIKLSHGLYKLNHLIHLNINIKYVLLEIYVTIRFT